MIGYVSYAGYVPDRIFPKILSRDFLLSVIIIYNNISIAYLFLSPMLKLNYSK